MRRRRAVRVDPGCRLVRYPVTRARRALRSRVGVGAGGRKLLRMQAELRVRHWVRAARNRGALGEIRELDERRWRAPMAVRLRLSALAARAARQGVGGRNARWVIGVPSAAHAASGNQGPYGSESPCVAPAGLGTGGAPTVKGGASDRSGAQSPPARVASTARQQAIGLRLYHGVALAAQPFELRPVEHRNLPADVLDDT